jgi:hypothetical protein
MFFSIGGFRLMKFSNGYNDAKKILPIHILNKMTDDSFWLD